MDTWVCACGEENDAQQRDCGSCGSRRPLDLDRADECLERGHSYSEDLAYCEHCGYRPDEDLPRSSGGRPSRVTASRLNADVQSGLSMMNDDLLGAIQRQLSSSLAALGGSVSDSGAGPRTGSDASGRAHFVKAPKEFAANWLVAIGVDRFDDPNVNPLQCCAADAKGLHDVFTSSGFVPASQAYALTTDSPDQRFHPRRNNILRALHYVAEHSGPESTIVLCFSSHGFTDDEGGSYILCEDAVASLPRQTAISITEVNTMLGQSASRRKIVFVDACRSSPSSGKALGGAAMSAAFLEALKAGEGQITMASCKAGEVSLEMREVGLGAFTHFVLEGLAGGVPPNEAGLISLWDLQAYLSEQVPAWCKSAQRPVQHPWMWGEMGAPILLPSVRRSR